MDWYYTLGQERRGPVDAAAFEALIADGSIAPDALVWNADLPDWVPLHTLRPTKPLTAYPPPALPPTNATPSTTFQRVYFGLLFVQVLLGVSQRFFYQVPGYLVYSIVMQIVFWVGMGTGLLALWEQGRNAPRALRLCVAVPLVWSLLYFVASRGLVTLITRAGSTDSYDSATGLITALRVCGFVSLGLHITCAGIGFNLLSQQRGLSR